MNTLYVDPQSWDLVLDASGNIAMASNPYSLVQDAASAIKTFSGECWYNADLGIPYFENILGKLPSMQYLKSQFVAAAKAVPEVIDAKCYLSGIANGKVTGQVQITDTAGNITAMGF